MARGSIIEVAGVPIDFRQIQGMDNVTLVSTEDGEAGAFDLHVGGTVFAFSDAEAEKAAAIWLQVFAQWKIIDPNVRRFDIGSSQRPFDLIAVDVTKITLVGPVQVMPVRQLHVQQRSIFSVHLNGSILRVDYATEIEAEKGRAEIIDAWKASSSLTSAGAGSAPAQAE